MTHADLTSLVRQGLAALEHGNTLVALLHFEQVAGIWPNAVVFSCLGYCIARERRDLERGLHLCREALRQEPANPLHYLNLGRVYLLAQQKHLAVWTFHKGMGYGRHPGLLRILERMGRRRPPVFARLGRKHFLNRYCGMLLSGLGLR
ncbi:MAG: hypothetical protein IH614_19315 [Desulfuromonadales bacterium]|nr:hypothetical protein [Desulfuromonadales bacterium]